MSMQRHHLNIMADVFYRISLPVIAVERWTGKPVWHLSSLDFVRKRGPICFSQSTTHGIHSSILGSPFFRGERVPNLIFPRVDSLGVASIPKKETGSYFVETLSNANGLDTDGILGNVIDFTVVEVRTD